MIKTLITATAVALVALPAAAQSYDDTARGYASLGYSQVETDQATLGAVTGRIGWKVMPWLGVEAEASVGVEDETLEVSIGGTGGSIELEHEVAACAAAFLPLGEHLELFARVGYGTTSIKSSTPAVTALGDGESFNYGVGASAFYGNNGLRVDWTRKDYQDNSGEADAWSLSYVRRF